MSARGILLGSNSSSDKPIESPAALFVSLYLVVLAFFILLNSISSIEEQKTKQAVESVKNTFSLSTVNVPRIMLKSNDQSGPQPVESSLFQPIYKLTKEYVELVDVRLLEQGNRLELTLRLDDFFIFRSSKPQPRKQDFLVKLADNLSALSTLQPITVEMMFPLALDRNEELVESLHARRAQQLFSELSQLGIDQRQILVGLTHGQGVDVFRLIFDATTSLISNSLPEERTQGVPENPHQ